MRAVEVLINILTPTESNTSDTSDSYLQSTKVMNL